MLEGQSPGEVEGWEDMFDEQVDRWNAAGNDYATCSEAASSSTESALTGKSVDGRLAERLANGLGIDGMSRITFKTAAVRSATGALKDSGIIDLVSMMSRRP
jgi:hypothetical protein